MQTSVRELKPGQMWIWFDGSGRTLDKILEDGVAAFQAKFGQRPTVCKLNPCHVNGQQEIKGIRLEAAENVLKWDFWFGVKDKLVAETEAAL